MRKTLWIALILFVLQSLALGQVVSVYCTWDDLEAARQQRIFGSGINEMMRSAGVLVVEKAYPNRSSLDGLIDENVKLVVASSHGSATTFYDCNDWSAIWTCESPEHYGPTKGKIVHLLACQNGQKLAPAMVEKGGAVAVLAYTENFNFSGQSKYNDYCAEGDAEFDFALVKDNTTTGEAYLRAKNKFIDFAQKASEEGQTGEYQTLMHNANCIALFGSQIATLQKNLTLSPSRQSLVVAKKFSKPSDAILKRVIVARQSGRYESFYQYRKNRALKPISKNEPGPFQNLSDRDFAEFALEYYQGLDDNYKLGIRAQKTYLLDKRQIMEEISKNTDLGKMLVANYRKFLKSLESIVEE